MARKKPCSKKPGRDLSIAPDYKINLSLPAFF